MQVPVFVGIFVCLSRRLHSIFVLRLFNDGIAMILLYAALIVYGKRRWLLGSFLYTYVLTVKLCDGVAPVGEVCSLCSSFLVARGLLSFAVVLMCFMYRVALSIKMNILLFLPGVAVSLVLAKGWTAIVDAALMVLVQVRHEEGFMIYL